MDADLRGGHRAATNLSGLLHSEALEIVEDECRPMIRGQAVDDLPDTTVHLVDDELLVDCGIMIGHLGRFVELHDVRPVRGLTKVVGRDPRGDGERPRLHAGTGTKARNATGDSNERFLEKVLSDCRISNVALKVAQEGLGEIPRELCKRYVMLLHV